MRGLTRVTVRRLAIVGAASSGRAGLGRGLASPSPVRPRLLRPARRRSARFLAGASAHSSRPSSGSRPPGGRSAGRSAWARGGLCPVRSGVTLASDLPGHRGGPRCPTTWIRSRSRSVLASRSPSISGRVAGAPAGACTAGGGSPSFGSSRSHLGSRRLEGSVPVRSRVRLGPRCLVVEPAPRGAAGCGAAVGAAARRWSVVCFWSMRSRGLASRRTSSVLIDSLSVAARPARSP